MSWAMSSLGDDEGMEDVEGGQGRSTSLEPCLMHFC